MHRRLTATMRHLIGSGVCVIATAGHFTPASIRSTATTRYSTGTLFR
jgi:hypothetical protein